MKPSHCYLLFAIAFVIIEALLMLYVDKPLSLYMRTVDVDHHKFVDFWRGYTDLGLSKWYQWPLALGASICALFVRLPSTKNKKAVAQMGERFLFVFCSISFAGLLTDAIKYCVGRARPVLLDREQFYGFHPFSHGNNWHSWPSGHSTTAFSLAVSLIILFPRLRIPALLFALSIPVSRVIVNAHYLSDTLAGALVGTLMVYATAWAFNHNGINHLRHCIFPIDSSKRRA
ncbi:MAG TPA: phosphatase PAP2 family protein [Alphaproteobacteria bacterium]|nr:phosphatase PAP2 family protein [Alphaproteobacteria bacterium]